MIHQSGLKSKIRLGLILIGWFLIGWFAHGFFVLATQPKTVILEQAADSIAKKAYSPDRPDQKELAYTAIKAMVSSLDDKYANFDDPIVARMKANNLSKDANLVLGIWGEMLDGEFIITTVLPGLPAKKAGIQEGDVIKEIDGWAVPTEAEADQVIAVLRNDDHPEAKIVIARKSQALTFLLEKQIAEEVSTTMYDNQVAYLRFDRFRSNTAVIFKKELEEVMQSNPKGIILDLRYNGGGWMTVAQEILDMFLDEGIAFYVQTQNGEVVSFPTGPGDITQNTPLVVLIGKTTISASETIAVSLQERGRATLIGETSYGKGSVIETIPLVDGSSIEFTVAHWLSPISKTYSEGAGIAPDILIKNEINPEKTDAVLEYAINYILR